MSFKHIHREEAPNVGDPADATIQELAGIAPPCDNCGSQPAVKSVHQKELCGDCLPEDEQ